MQPTRILANEHRVIEVVLNCLERITEKAVQDSSLDHVAADQVLDFIRIFADSCHHGKEEAHLFAAMHKKGLPTEGGPIGQMLREHQQGRAFVKAMTESLEAAAAGDQDALIAFTSNALGYIRLLRGHIRKEDTVLFPLADRLLNNKEQEELLAAFAEVESQHVLRDAHEEYLRLAESLADRFGVSKQGLALAKCGHSH
jgi:hemerythrin-like domain-containing protein